MEVNNSDESSGASTKQFVFPATYFNEDGGIPENLDTEIHNLKARWHFQLNVAKNSIGENDYSTFDADLVVAQMRAMKASLKEYAKERYWVTVKREANHKGMNHCNQRIVTNQDLCEALKRLKRDDRSEQMVYLVLYGWFRNCYKFEKETVDEWAKKNHYVIQMGTRCGRRRVKDPIMDRHGFGQIVKDSRSDTIKTIARGMARDAMWKVVATNKSKQSEKNEVYHEKRCVMRNTKFYVVVTESETVCTLQTESLKNTCANWCFLFFSSTGAEEKGSEGNVLLFGLVW
jgi:hypothetical protein